MQLDNQFIKEIYLRMVPQEHRSEPIDPYYNGGENSDKINVTDEIFDGAFNIVESLNEEHTKD